MIWAGIQLVLSTSTFSRFPFTLSFLASFLAAQPSRGPFRPPALLGALRECAQSTQRRKVAPEDTTRNFRVDGGGEEAGAWNYYVLKACPFSGGLAQSVKRPALVRKVPGSLPRRSFWFPFGRTLLAGTCHRMSCRRRANTCDAMWPSPAAQSRVVACRI